MEITRNDDESW